MTPTNEVSTVSEAQLRSLVRPRSIALVGASAASHWCELIMGNLSTLGFSGDLFLVNPKGGSAFGHDLYASLADIGEPVDLAVLMVSARSVLEILPEMASAGIPAGIVLASGYAEVGGEGQDRQKALRETALSHGIALLGPNSLGVLNMVDSSPAWIAPVPNTGFAGSIAVVSQSGNLGQVVADLAASFSIGLSHVVSTGNEAVVDASDVLGFLIEDSRVKVAAVFAEAIRNPTRFLEVAARAAALSKPIVMLKAGATELGRQVARTHTGALAGDDRVIAAAFRSAGVIRVESLEQLVATAGLLAATGPLRAGGLGVLSISGGSNDIIADRATTLGIDLPPLSEATMARMASSRVEIATLQNPFDMTGAAGRLGDAWVSAMTAMAADPAYALVVSPFARLAHPLNTSGEGLDVERFGWVFEGAAKAANGCPAFLMLNTMQPVTPEQGEALRGLGSSYVLPGMEHGLIAIRDAFEWSRWLRAGPRLSRLASEERPDSQEKLSSGEKPVVDPHGLWPEWRALELLGQHGVPVVPWRFASNRDEAVTRALELGFPVVVKVSSPEIEHKTEVGGVVLNIESAEEVAVAFDAIAERAQIRAGVRIEGVIVMPMRSGGHELLLGTLRDDTWGLVLLLGMGGIFAEVVDDTAARLLPVTTSDVAAMLRELRSFPLLEGVRGQQPADLDEVCRVVSAFASLAEKISDDLESLEVNPLRVDGKIVEALDALVLWRGPDVDGAQIGASARGGQP